MKRNTYDFKIDQNAPWTLENATRLMKFIAPRLEKIGFYIGITGSVILKGGSEKDLDLIVYPHDTGNVDLEALANLLVSMKWERRATTEQVWKTWGVRFNSFDRKRVEVWDVGDYRIDLFILK